MANVSFETIRYDVNEGDGQVELALNLSHPLPLEFNASLRLNAIDDTNDTNATFISTGGLYLLHRVCIIILYTYRHGTYVCTQIISYS